MIRVEVRTGSSSYDVLVGAGLLHRAGELLPAFPGAERAFVLGDQRVAALYLEPLTSSLALPTVHVPVPEGEEAKSLGTVESLYGQLAIQEAHRDDPVLALGGGATGDVAGFVAATYMRGVPLVHVPTSLTAQVDASVGGKVGVNLSRGKNLVGAFYQPAAVVSDVATLATLPDREFRSGLAEVAKYGLAVDPTILDLLDSSLSAVLARDPDALTKVVAACVRAKAGVVAEDEPDRGGRAVLNYGHTLGHVLERLSDYEGPTHGEAVSAGMVFAARLAQVLGVAGPDLAGRHVRLLAALGLPHEGPALDPADVVDAFRMDKKYREGVRFVLLEDVGRPRLVDGVGEAEIREALALARGAA